VIKVFANTLLIVCTPLPGADAENRARFRETPHPVSVSPGDPGRQSNGCYRTPPQRMIGTHSHQDQDQSVSRSGIREVIVDRWGRFCRVVAHSWPWGGSTFDRLNGDRNRSYCCVSNPTQSGLTPSFESGTLEHGRETKSFLRTWTAHRGGQRCNASMRWTVELGSEAASSYQDASRTLLATYRNHAPPSRAGRKEA